MLQITTRLCVLNRGPVELIWGTVKRENELTRCAVFIGEMLHTVRLEQQQHFAVRASLWEGFVCCSLFDVREMYVCFSFGWILTAALFLLYFCLILQDIYRITCKIWWKELHARYDECTRDKVVFSFQNIYTVSFIILRLIRFNWYD